mmetsp:Transcript_48945/g.72765  ORF Transcript_48945/g.72765 Transcript_48945/m.72765 type:complete len:181 (-) Transcript_48945:238-780(-)|eukprot:CAMPEP_0195508844 /NCGR_PEP_ID=MMETSP0794_2-20130614/1949_1 /TAXON_ID=515487 /ORGANISM="Stephanopyxis turris, Strain CCMP 815" /LENGTH=180 /DNA_ID=CAMNT_0040635917 /DNA_START=132 /DNA_END=674 /DNA_ORIENTATION=+
MNSGRLKLTKLLMRSPKKPKPQLKEAEKKTRWNIVRGDKVQVIGKHPEKGKQGIVLSVYRKADRVTIEGVNVRPRAMKGDPERGIKGKIKMEERSIHYSNVNLVDPVTGYPTRVTRKFLEDGTKVRVAKQSGAIIPRPDILGIRRPVSQVVTDKCTVGDELVWGITYEPPSQPGNDEKSV